MRNAVLAIGMTAAMFRVTLAAAKSACIVMGGFLSVMGPMHAEGGAVLPDPRNAAPTNSPPLANGSVTKEHFAFAGQQGYLDGPRREAFAGRDARPAFDDQGNIYFFTAFGWGAIRCIRTDGQIVTVTGNDYFTSDLKLVSGPASAFGNPAGVRGFSFGTPSGWLAVAGTPDEGEDKGCIYASDPHAGVARIFRNRDKGNRWWFERIVGGGKERAPRKRGGVVDAREIGLRSVAGLQLNKDKKLCVLGDGSFLEYDGGKLTCLLGPEDYGTSGPRQKNGEAAGPSEGFIGGDGSFYLSFYYSGYTTGSGGTASIWRASADGGKMEPFAKDNHNSHRDGDAMKDAGWHCGPHLCPHRNNIMFQPPGVVFTSTHDEDNIRRIRNGRVATLCVDGEWRENPGRGTPPVKAGNQWYVAPDCAAVRSYSGGDFEWDCRMWMLRNIDWNKSTIGGDASRKENKQ